MSSHHQRSLNTNCLFHFKGYSNFWGLPPLLVRLAGKWGQFVSSPSSQMVQEFLAKWLLRHPRAKAGHELSTLCGASHEEQRVTNTLTQTLRNTCKQEQSKGCRSRTSIVYGYKFQAIWMKQKKKTKKGEGEGKAALVMISYITQTIQRKRDLMDFKYLLERLLLVISEIYSITTMKKPHPQLLNLHHNSHTSHIIYMNFGHY